MVDCPICGKGVKARDINSHIDSGCSSFLSTETGPSPPPTQQNGTQSQKPHASQKPAVSSFFQTPAAKRVAVYPTPKIEPSPSSSFHKKQSSSTTPVPQPRKRSFDDVSSAPVKEEEDLVEKGKEEGQPAKKTKTNAFQKAAPLAERMRPRNLDDVCGQELVGPRGVLRSLIEQDRVPSMILWGGAGTGKTTIARCIASMVGSRFVEINSTSSGVAECKKIFAEARGELGLTGRKTIIFCDVGIVIM